MKFCAKKVYLWLTAVKKIGGVAILFFAKYHPLFYYTDIKAIASPCRIGRELIFLDIARIYAAWLCNFEEDR